MFSIPASLICGIIGVFTDERKGLAILTTLVSGTLVGLWLLAVAADL